MRRLLKSQSGFTLIELLIVVLIIGVLAGIAVPRVAGYSNAAKKRACQANMKQIATALEAYYIDHGQYPDKLDTLAEKYLKAVPECPESGRGYKYKKNNGSFELTCDEHSFKITDTTEDWGKSEGSS